ncbi:hypothetical protein Mal52_55390 [Symmachiella dynata]|uniref:CopZ zinc binding domain-containing protein n=1 Tax=Symmachiella dynata TaxID=2527995 RepID=A0A517ZWZ7_9PLAN|nr:hypothetical protein [Symmachiella dynata]QDU47011.1 hypothetical protein Mal52_55390 [Symmachiella dynata]
MNKAFVKEPEDHGDRCPACGTVGHAVYRETLVAHLPEELRNQISDAAFFCPHPPCSVAYFDQMERTIAATSLLQPVYPKDPAAPICPCFGLTCDEIEEAALSGDVAQVREHLQRAATDEAHCVTAATDGQSCVANVQRHFMRFHGQ